MTPTASPPPRPFSRRTIGSAFIRRGLRQIYHARGVRGADLTRLERGKRHRLRTVIIVVVLLIAVATVLGVWVFTGGGKFSRRVAFTIDAPQTIASGDTVRYRITYVNQDAVDYADVELTVQLPASFTFQEAQPAASNDFHNAWSLGRVPAGRSGEVELVGQIVGEVDSTHDLAATLSYQPVNFSSTFQTTARHTVRITSSVLTLAIEGPEEAIPGTEVALTVQVSTSAPSPLRDVRVRGVFPSAFTMTSADPAPRSASGGAGEQALWAIDTLASDAPYTFTVHGRFTGEVGSMREVQFEGGLATGGSTFQRQVTSTHVVLLTQPSLELSARVNGAAERVAVQPGDTLEVQLDVKNASDLLMQNVFVRVALDAQPGAVLDYTTYESPNGGTPFGDAVTWDQEAVPSLASLAPDATVSISFTIDVLQELAVQDADDREFSVQVKATATPRNLPDLPEATYEASSSAVDVRVGTDASFTSAARYASDSGETLGSGPIPPEVGAETTYRIIWTVGSTSNALSTARIRGILPKGVVWKGAAETTAGSLEYQPKRRRVEWTLDRLPEHTGARLPAVTISFTVAITPDAGDIDQFVTLLEESQLTAKDSWTDVAVERSAPALTTDLPDDPAAAGNGRVVPAS